MKQENSLSHPYDVDFHVSRDSLHRKWVDLLEKQESQFSDYENGFLDGINGFLSQRIQSPEYMLGFREGHMSCFMTHGSKLIAKCPVEGYCKEEIEQYR